MLATSDLHAELGADCYLRRTLNARPSASTPSGEGNGNATLSVARPFPNAVPARMHPRDEASAAGFVGRSLTHSPGKHVP
jgi:hypothetical protein